MPRDEPGGSSETVKRPHKVQMLGRLRIETNTLAAALNTSTLVTCHVVPFSSKMTFPELLRESREERKRVKPKAEMLREN